MSSTKNPPSPQDSAPWIARAKLGDAASIERALEPFRGYLTMIADRAIDPRLASTVEAADAVQETFLAAHRAIAGFRGSTEAEWRAWLKAILINHLINLRRAHLDSPRRGPVSFTPPRVLELDDVLLDDATPPSVRLRTSERDLALEAAIRQLPEHYRIVVLLRGRDGLSFDAIADRLETSAEAARKIWTRALKQLRTTLGADHDPHR